MVMMIVSVGDDHGSIVVDGPNDHGSIVVDGPDSYAAAADLRTLRYR